MRKESGLVIARMIIQIIIAVLLVTALEIIQTGDLTFMGINFP
jgi:hypothetical protein